MKKQLLLFLALCATLSVVAQPYSRPELPTIKVTYKDGKYGITDNNDRCLIPNVLDDIKRTKNREYMISVKYEKEYFIIDRKGCMVANAGSTVPLTYDQFVVINRSSAIDCNGKELFPGKTVSPITITYGENRFYLFANKPKKDKNSSSQLVTINNEVVSNKPNGYFSALTCGVILFNTYQSDQCGVLNSLGEVLVPYNYSAIEVFDFNNLQYKCDLDKTALLKLYDSYLYPTIGLFVARKGSYYTIYDQSGTQLTQPKQYKDSTDAIKKSFKKYLLPHFLRRGSVMHSIQEKINNPNHIRYEEYLAAANRLPIYSSAGKSLSSHLAYLEEHPNLSAYTPAECFNKGKKLYDENRYQQAIPWLLHAAEGKYQPAYRKLADSYNNAKQFQKANSWYKNCIKELTPGSNDYWFACMMLGGMYRVGRGCEKNYDTSLYYLRLFHQNTTQINKSTASEMIAEVVALKNEANPQRQQSASNSSSSSSKGSKYTPTPNTMPNEAKSLYYMNKAGHIASLFIKYYEKESLTPQPYWGGQVFVYRGGGPGTGYIHYYSWDYNQNGVWVFKECDMFGRKGIDMFGRAISNGGLLYVANDWSYIKEGNEVFDIPISKEKFDSLQSTGYINTGGGGGGSMGSTGSTQIQSGMSESYYRSMYAQYERLAESTYSTLNATGVDIHYSDGSRKGYTAGGWSSSDYSTLKRDLRNAQSNMRRIRSEAAQAGYNIAPSHWENATVSY